MISNTTGEEHLLLTQKYKHSMPNVKESNERICRNIGIQNDVRRVGGGLTWNY